ncbi:hypothetical protein M8J77_007650 [Diaphorina citri]|nr:hypothetical protein M8J77_007650 [Diaphorina citri]
MDIRNLNTQIKHNIFWVFELSKYIGSFPYDILSLKLNKSFTTWSILVHLSAILLMTSGYLSYTSFTNSKIEVYSILMTKLLLISFGVKCATFLYFKFKVVSRLKEILLELNQIHAYFEQLSCLDIVPDRVARKQGLTIAAFFLTHLFAFSFRMTMLTKFRNDLTFALYIINFLTFSTVLQCTNLLDLVKHYLNIINIELINISNNQDKQHFIHLYKSRICVLNNMLPENYLCRRKLKVLLLLHFCLCKLSDRLVNRLFAVHIGITMFNECLQLTTNLYFLVVLFVQSKSLMAVWTYIFYISLWVVYNLLMLLWIIKHCVDTKEALTEFLDRVCSHKLHFTVFEFFDIDYSVLRNLLGAVLSFGIIVIQLSVTS